MSRRYRYKERPSGLLGMVKRPLIDLEILENRTGLWYKVEDVLVDTGADVTMMPRRMRFLLDGPLEGGTRREIKGVVPQARLTVYMHILRLRFNGYEFDSPVLISERDDVFPILGRKRPHHGGQRNQRAKNRQAVTKH